MDAKTLPWGRFVLLSDCLKLLDNVGGIRSIYLVELLGLDNLFQPILSEYFEFNSVFSVLLILDWVLTSVNMPFHESHKIPLKVKLS